MQVLRRVDQLKAGDKIQVDQHHAVEVFDVMHRIKHVDIYFSSYSNEFYRLNHDDIVMVQVNSQTGQEG